MENTITIEYCPKCNWLLRAAYMAQELLVTFGDELLSVTLEQSKVSGKFSIYIDGNLIFDRKTNGGFEDIKTIKQLVRDVVNPQKSLGHSDKP